MKLQNVKWRRLQKSAATWIVASALLTAAFARTFHAQEHAVPSDVKTEPDNLIAQGKREPAPDFTLRDSDGKPLTLSHFKGRVVLLDFWATWCGGCKLELPWYVEFDHKYRAEGLTAVGVSMDEGGMNVVKPFLLQKHISYPSVIGNDALASRFHLESMPLTVLIDKHGRVALAHNGVVDKNNFASHLQELLREK